MNAEVKEMLRRGAGLRQFVLFGSFFVMLILTSFTGELIVRSGFDERTSLLLTSIVQCVLAFCIPAYLTAMFSSSEPLRFLCLTGRDVSMRAYVGVLIVYVLALPAMNQLIEWNQSIHFPEWGVALEKSLRDMEDANNAVAQKILGANNIWQMLAGIGVVGVLTGFSEELFFRGALQGIYDRTGCRRWIAVWGTAVIFSAIHFQFFGFFPRLLMGAFFGYLLLWTGSLWPCIFAHALNNSVVVFATWASDGKSEDGLDSFGIVSGGNFPWLALASCMVTVFFLIWFRQFFFYSKKRLKDGQKE